MKLTSHLFEQRRSWAERLHRYWYKLVGPIERRQAIARQQRYCGTYVGITGSCGKSTTALLVRTMLAEYGSVHSGGLININRAVFRTLRKLRRPTDYVVQEISAHAGPGGLTPVTQALRFDVSIVTAIGKEHRTNFESIKDIAAEKSRILSAVHANGLSLLNADDPLVRAMREVAGGRVLMFGTSPDADVRAENVRAAWPERLSFDLVIGDRRWPVTTSFAGTLMLTNILAAFGVVHGLGLDLGPAIARVAALDPVFEHMSIHDASDGHTYILDTNKAPLWSTTLLVNDLRNFTNGSTVLLLSQISDTFGDRSQWYRKLLRQAAATVPHVIAMGQAAKQAAKLIEDEGLSNIRLADSLADVRTILAELPPSLVIVKTAEATKLSRLWLATIEPVTCTRPTCHLTISCRNCPLLRAA